MSLRLRVGTRGSALARAQTAGLAAELKAAHPGLEVEIIPIQTSGDRFSLSAPPDAPAASDGPNVKAMFVKEIEEALLDGRIDLAVHSAKDLPADLPEGLAAACYPRREDPRDVLVTGASAPALESLPKGAAVGTSSLRRGLQLKLHRLDLEIRSLRGNVDTRLKRLAEGGMAAVVLAEAGLRRLDLDVPRRPIPVEVMVPAPGQGALAVEAREDRRDLFDLLKRIEDPDARLEAELERAVLRGAGGGCSTPLGALARAAADGVSLTVFWSDPEGRRPVRLSGRSSRRPEELKSLAEGIVGGIHESA